MVEKRNWREITPRIAHNTAAVYRLISTKNIEDPGASGGGPPTLTPLQGFYLMTLHLLPPGMSGDRHTHFDREQLFYFTEGRATMNVDDKLYSTRKGDAVCVPIGSVHQVMNDTDDWLVHLVINGKLVSPEEQESNRKKGEEAFHNIISHRNALDSGPSIASQNALRWSIFAAKGHEGMTYNEAPLEGMMELVLHRLQPSLQTRSDIHEYEQVYYFTAGRGTMVVGEEKFPTRDGDVVYVPPKVPHQVINDSDDWLEHLLMSAEV